MSYASIQVEPAAGGFGARITGLNLSEPLPAAQLVRTHPVTGRKALYVSPTYTLGIADMRPDESAHLLDFLYRHATQDEYVYRQKWQPNTLTMWDNRCTLHNAEGGYDGHLRVMHRTTVAGETPV